MTDAERYVRIQAMLGEERAAGQLTWWYLSFARDAATFLGAVFVQAYGITDATRRAHELGINPGGWVSAHRLLTGHGIPEKYRERLLTTEDIAELDKLAAPQ